MTSSNYLKSGLRKSLAFPIMLTAVGLLLATLVFGIGSNLARALGPVDSSEPQGAGICGYSELIRDAILANNDHKSYDCDHNAYTGTGQGSGAWGGVKSTDDSPNDLDLTGASEFAPGKGELDGFKRGSRVDLRGTGLGVADLDVSKALGTHDAATRTYPNFGDSTEGTLNEIAPPADPSPINLVADATGDLGLTFLLDGGSSVNGLAAQAYEGTEGEILWITFQYGAKPKEFAYPDDSSKSVWMRVDVRITHDDSNGVTAAGGDSSVVSILINSKDAADTLYAVPFKLPDDYEIEFRPDSEDIDVTFGDAGTFEEASTTGGTPITGFTFGTDLFEKSLPRKGDEAALTIIDEDTPAVPLADRQDVVEETISDFFNTSSKRVGVDHLAGEEITVGSDMKRLQQLFLGKAADGETAEGDDAEVKALSDDTDAITSISTDDLAGLTGLTVLDLSDNEIAELPSGLFAQVGSKGKGDLSTEINLTGAKMGPTGAGFMLDNLGPVGDELIAGQYLIVQAPENDKRIGFLQDSYMATEGGVLVFDINIRGADFGGTGTNAAIQFLTLSGDNGNLAPGTDEKPKDVNAKFIDLRGLAAGNYRIAIGLPENKVESGDNTLTAVFGYVSSNDAAVDLNGASSTVTMTTILDVVPVTIRDVSSEAPATAPAVPESSFESVVVTQNEYVEGPGNEDLKHNISNLTVTVGGNAVSANFLDVYNATGGLERWGYPTSEVVEIPGIGLTQFFQRGALHLASNETVTRLLAWDYVGGGLGGSTDQGVEAAPDSAPEGGEQVGAFGHYVANVDADGNATGFLDFFNRLGGVDAFGIPKTEARADTGADGTLMEPGTTAGFTRQYFQAAVFQLAEDGSVQLTLLGDTLRGILVPGYADIDAFGAADQLSVGDEVSPPVISS